MASHPEIDWSSFFEVTDPDALKPQDVMDRTRAVLCGVANQSIVGKRFSFHGIFTRKNVFRLAVGASSPQDKLFILEALRGAPGLTVKTIEKSMRPKFEEAFKGPAAFIGYLGYEPFHSIQGGATINANPLSQAPTNDQLTADEYPATSGAQPVPANAPLVVLNPTHFNPHAGSSLATLLQPPSSAHSAYPHLVDAPGRTGNTRLNASSPHNAGVPSTNSAYKGLHPSLMRLQGTVPCAGVMPKQLSGPGGYNPIVAPSPFDHSYALEGALDVAFNPLLDSGNAAACCPEQHAGPLHFLGGGYGGTPARFMDTGGNDTVAQNYPKRAAHGQCLDGPITNHLSLGQPFVLNGFEDRARNGFPQQDLTGKHYAQDALGQYLILDDPKGQATRDIAPYYPNTAVFCSAAQYAPSASNSQAAPYTVGPTGELTGYIHGHSGSSAHYALSVDAPRCGKRALESDETVAGPSFKRLKGKGKAEEDDGDKEIEFVSKNVLFLLMGEYLELQKQKDGGTTGFDGGN